MEVVTRFAPSPTGYLHVGGLRTALYNYLFARKLGGKMILRIEDTDRERLVPGAIEALIRTLDLTKITYDEGPFLENGKVVQRGASGPYIQSERLPIYREAALRLVKEGKAYYCFCSKERLDEVRKRQTAANLQPKYDRQCLSLSQQEIEKHLSSGDSYVIRMKIPEGKGEFEDLIRGRVEIDHEQLDDQVLLKSDGFPTYHLAVVVDDHAMGVTYVIRAEEWLSSTPKHVILYKMFGWPVPVFAHLPLILNPDRSKLSKRQGDVAVEDYLAKGYLPEAIVNFVALLGYNPKADQEIYTLEELVSLFELENVNKAGAVFDLPKLNWMNGEYIRNTPDDRLLELTRPFVERAGMAVEGEPSLAKVLAVEKTRLTTLSEVPERLREYRSRPVYDADLLIWKKSTKDEAKDVLNRLRQFVSELPETTFDSVELFEKAIKEYITLQGLKNGPVLWPLRVALSGKEASPSPFELAWIFGKAETLVRIDSALALLHS